MPAIPAPSDSSERLARTAWAQPSPMGASATLTFGTVSINPSMPSTAAPFAVIQSRPTAGAMSRSLTLSPIATASSAVRPRRPRSQAMAAPF